jgi:hypothetical protein
MAFTIVEGNSVLLRCLMNLNYLGLVAALSIFLGIWWGHVGVRKIEAISIRLWPPMLIATFLGIIFEFIATRTESMILSAACGILGVTLLWDAFEFYRQEKRIKGGHAPANPNNPRHARILAAYPEATTFDWLDRNPREQAYSTGELEAMKGDAK